METTLHLVGNKAPFFFDHLYYLVVVLSTGEFLELQEILNPLIEEGNHVG